MFYPRLHLKNQSYEENSHPFWTNLNHFTHFQKIFWATKQFYILSQNAMNILSVVRLENSKLWRQQPSVLNKSWSLHSVLKNLGCKPISYPFTKPPRTLTECFQTVTSRLFEYLTFDLTRKHISSIFALI